MQHDEAAELLAAFALNALPNAEREVVAAHIRACADCGRQLAALGEVVAVLPLALDPVAPSPEVRRRLLTAVSTPGRIGSRRRWPGRLPERGFRNGLGGWLAAAALFLAALGFGGWGLAEYHQLHSAAQVVLGAAAKGGAARGVVVLPPGQPATVRVSNLPTPAPDRVYEAWVIHAGVPEAAGIFVTSANGMGGLELTRMPAPGDQVVVTLEPAPGGAAPKGPAVLQGTVRA